MTHLVPVCRLARAVAEVAIRSDANDRMEFAVAARLPRRNSVEAATAIARGLGFGVVLVGLPLASSIATVAEIGRSASERLSYLTGPAIILLYAEGFDDDDRQRQVITGVASLAREAWSVNGETFLLVVAPEDDREAIARIVGDTVGIHDVEDALAL